MVDVDFEDRAQLEASAQAAHDAQTDTEREAESLFATCPAEEVPYVAYTPFAVFANTYLNELFGVPISAAKREMYARAISGRAA